MQWNEDEDDALQGLPHLAQVLYLRGLRPYFDQETGLVQSVSYWRLRNLLAVKRRRGSTIRDDETITTKQIRVALEQLESAGLIVRKGKKDKFGYMVIGLPLANPATK